MKGKIGMAGFDVSVDMRSALENKKYISYKKIKLFDNPSIAECIRYVIDFIDEKWKNNSPILVFLNKKDRLNEVKRSLQAKTSLKIKIHVFDPSVTDL